MTRGTELKVWGAAKRKSWISACGMLLVLGELALCMISLAPSVAEAQTPASYGKSCNYAGGPACPAVPPAPGQWQFTFAYGGPAPNSSFHSLSDIQVWWSNYLVTEGGVCSATPTTVVEGENDWGPVPDLNESAGGKKYKYTTGANLHIQLKPPNHPKPTAPNAIPARCKPGLCSKPRSAT